MLNKLRNPVSFYKLVVLIFSTSLPALLLAQDSSYTRPQLTDKWREYRQQVLHDTAKKMVELRSLMPGLVYELRYAGRNNFMQREMYPSGTSFTFLRKPAAEALQKVQGELRTKGLGLKIFDAYRPWSVTAKFWELVHDERYVANPSKGSGHNRGIAVDLTLINLSTGQELNMGTAFDNFTDTARADFANLPPDVLQNRQLLRTTMEKYGFKVLDTEWWHFYLPESSRFEVLDIPFRKLKKRL
jgi:D-alanyl-D-alanine dipeptidase